MSLSFSGWRFVFNLRRHLYKGLLVLVALLGLELVAAWILPHLVPQTSYLRSYLGWKVLINTQNFVRGRFYLEPDNKCGWRNRPYGQSGEVKFDAFGTRGGLSGEPWPDRNRTRVLLLGNSLIYGGFKVTNQETLNAYLSGSGLAALNLACTTYALDQMRLALEDQSERFSPDWVVLGIDSNPGYALDTHFMRFLRKDYPVVLLKPRYVLQGGKLELLLPPNRELLADGDPVNGRLISFLKENDPLFYRFKDYQRWQTTPFLALWAKVEGRFGQLLEERGWNRDQVGRSDLSNWPLARELLKGIKDTARQKGIRLLILVFPNRVEIREKENPALEEITGFLAKESIPYLDLRRVLAGYQGDSDDLYGDHNHLIAAGNRLLAQHLAAHITREARSGPGSRVAAGR